MKSFLIAALLITGTVHGQTMIAQKTTDFKKTRKNVESFLKAKKLTTFATIDHSDGAKKAGLTMPASVVFVFGNPMVGTPLMVANPHWAIHLPLKVAVYEDVNGKVYMAVTDVKSIAKKDKIPATQMPVIEKMDTLLNALLDVK